MNPVDFQDLWKISKEGLAATNHGLIRNCPFQDGEWKYYPVYRDGTEVVIDLKEQEVYTRCLNKPVVGLSQEVWCLLSKLGLPCEYRWLHATRIHSLDAQNPVNQAVVIHDLITRDGNTAQRREVLDKINIRTLGFRRRPIAGEVYLVPEYTEHVCADLWCALHLTNQTWNIPFYGGILAKEATSIYRHQLFDYKKPSLAWMRHPFANAF